MSCSARMRPWRGPRAEKGGHGVFHAAGGVCRSFLEHSKVRGSSSGLLDGYWLAGAGWMVIFGPAAGGGGGGRRGGSMGGRLVYY